MTRHFHHRASPHALLLLPPVLSAKLFISTSCFSVRRSARDGRSSKTSGGLTTSSYEDRGKLYTHHRASPHALLLLPPVLSAKLFISTSRPATTGAAPRFVPPDTRKPTGLEGMFERVVAVRDDEALLSGGLRMTRHFHHRASPHALLLLPPVLSAKLFISTSRSRHLCATAVRPARYAETDRVGGDV
jgi:hypothetical protein